MRRSDFVAAGKRGRRKVEKLYGGRKAYLKRCREWGRKGGRPRKKAVHN